MVAIRRGGDQVVVTSIHPQDFADCTYGADPAQVHVLSTVITRISRQRPVETTLVISLHIVTACGSATVNHMLV